MIDAARPGPAASPQQPLAPSWLRRLTGTNYGGVGCVGPRCADRTATLQTLAVLNAQGAVRTAVDFGDGYSAYGATQSAQRSAIAAAYGDLGYLGNQQIWDRGGSIYYGRR